ncbi:NAD(P)-binding protein [Athelia psychrophila]|uniref:NAD(P)-binding protein n=1 Tax=Athelia psychrophila TaxID=1759441 RepID=A0A166B624_9AGAM|nr:NAD(P)-binding protein [Fibularhizoctonia sp. CBS 109695]
MTGFTDFLTQSFPAKSIFKVEDIPDLSGKVALVTGANTGVGLEIAKALLFRNAKVYIASRNQEKAEAAIEHLRGATGKEAVFLKLDLAALGVVAEAAKRFLSRETELHMLFNNGGVLGPPIDQLTDNGIDLQFGTNVLGHYYLTSFLLPALLKAASSDPSFGARVVTTSSLGHHFQDINYATLKDGPERRKMGPQRLYCQSKYGNVVFAAELSRRYGKQGIISTSVHPGSIKSEIHRHMNTLSRFLMKAILYEPSYGALTSLWAGTTDAGKELNGKYLVPWARIGSPRPDSQDPEVGGKLWAWLEEQVAEFEKA